ncbi:MAG: SAM-dependent chlorinase/fluorinase, partial [Chloroflexi bacterium]|nr:SAM-dependent chlorinase/fluorinase [Chloroflexota bacterium]
ISRTFHGRDIFAPVAARLSRGLPIARVGTKQNDFTRLSWPRPRETTGTIKGEVIYIDRFGNAITNISVDRLSEQESSAPTISVKGKLLGPLQSCYAQVPRGQPLATVGSSGFLEIAVNRASAARVLHLRIGNPVVVRD